MMVDVSKLAVGDSVVVEGSLSPAMGYLKRGEQAEVAFSETVADLHRKGFIVVKGKSGEVPVANPVTPTVPPVSFEKPDQTVPTVPTVPSAPEATPVTPTVPQGTDQGLVNATPVQGTDSTVPTVNNPAVDNSLVDSGAAAGQAKSASTSTSRK